MKYLLLLLTCFIPCFADEEAIEIPPDQIAALRVDSKDLIGGLISPLGGYPCLKVTDFVVKGAQDITLSRIYHPPHIPLAFPTTNGF